MNDANKSGGSGMDTLEPVEVSSGANNPMKMRQLVGKTVSEARNEVAEPLNVKEDHVALVGGQPANEDRVLEPGDKLEFLPETPEKG